MFWFYCKLLKKTVEKKLKSLVIDKDPKKGKN